VFDGYLIAGHALEIRRRSLQSDFDERFQIYSSDLAPGNRLAAEVLPDPETGGRNPESCRALP
jgi:hypothetical protein